MTRIKNKMIDVSTDFDINNKKLVKVSNPSAPTDAVNLQTLDARLQGLNAKKAAKHGTKSNITNFASLSVVRAALDRVSGADPVVINRDRVLVKDQTKKDENGIYFWNGAELIRTEDADQNGELKGGDLIFVTTGDTLADQGFTITLPDGPVTIGTSEITWAPFSSKNTGAGNGLVQNGNNIDLNVDTNGGIEVTGDKVKIKVDGDSVKTGASGIKAAVPTRSDKNRAPTAVTTDGTTTGLTLTGLPAGDGYVQVVIGGVPQTLGDGNKNAPVYFSSDGGTTAKQILSLAGGETLYFNPSIAKFNLETTDLVSFHYNVI